MDNKLKQIFFYVLNQPISDVKHKACNLKEEQLKLMEGMRESDLPSYVTSVIPASS